MFPQLLTLPTVVFGLICIIQPFKGICLICILLIKDVVFKKKK